MIAYDKHQCTNPVDVYLMQFGIKCLSHLLQLEPCNIMFQVISDIMAHWHDL